MSLEWMNFSIINLLDVFSSEILGFHFIYIEVLLGHFEHPRRNQGVMGL